MPRGEERVLSGHQKSHRVFVFVCVVLRLCQHLCGQLDFFCNMILFLRGKISPRVKGNSMYPQNSYDGILTPDFSTPCFQTSLWWTVEHWQVKCLAREATTERLPITPCPSPDQDPTPTRVACVAPDSTCHPPFGPTHLSPLARKS